MAILESEILQVVNANLRRNETDIDAELKTGLRRISAFGDFLVGTDTQTIQAGDNLLTPTDDYKTITDVRVTSVDTDPSTPTEIDAKEPLYLIGWPQYLTKIGRTSAQAQPNSYAVRNDEIYLYPVANISYNVDIYYTRYHPYSTTIEYSEKFREAIEAITTLNVAKKYGLDRYIALWSSVSLGSLNSLMATEPAQARFTRYTGI